MALTKTDIANWMIEVIRGRRGTDQGTIVAQLQLAYGHETEWLVKTKAGGLGIAPEVLAEFKKLHQGTIKWEAGYKYWSNVPQPDAEEAIEETSEAAEPQGTEEQQAKDETQG